MPWISGALAVGGALISSSGASNAAGIQASATDRAAQTQADATQKSIAEMARQYDLTRSDQYPYRAAGASALTQLQTLLGLKVAPQAPGPGNGVITGYNYQGGNYGSLQDIRQSMQDDYTRQTGRPSGADNNAAIENYLQNATPVYGADPNAPPPVDPTTSPDFGSLNKKFSISDFWNDPVVQASYQSGLDLGTKALKNAAPLTTGLDSGAALKELTKFGTDYTGNMAAGSQNRFVGDQTNQYNRLMGIISGGQTANATTANAGSTAASGIAGATMNGGTNIANLYSNLGNAQGAASIAGANSFGSGLSSVSNFWNQQQMLNQMRGGGYSPYNIGSYGNFNMPQQPGV